MNISSVSTIATNLLATDSVSSAQKKLNDAVTEQSTLRHADVGLTLGANVSRNLNWRLALSETSNFLDANGQASSKAEALQTALDTTKTTASSFLESLTGARNASNGQSLIKQSSSLALDSVATSVNVNYGGQYLMAGQNTDVAPLNTYIGGAAQTAYDNAFQSYFGVAKTDPAAVNITAAQMKSFLDGPFESLFQSPSWETNFSNASANNLQTRIDSNQQIDLSANANEAPFKDLMRSMVAAQEAGAGKLNSAAFQQVIDYSISKVGGSVQTLGETQSRVGEGQQALAQANTKLTAMKTLFESEIQRTEGVDPAEAATRVTNLTTQLEANYTVTGKLAKLSLMNYL
jgi:flagellar hook-associated protein 3 FlgL